MLVVEEAISLGVVVLVGPVEADDVELLGAVEGISGALQALIMNASGISHWMTRVFRRAGRTRISWCLHGRVCMLSVADVLLFGHK